MLKNNFWGYKDEHKHERFVSNVNFIHDIDVLNPLSLQYKKYWKDLKRRCIEGYWFEGKWMPGSLYFYVNFCKIRLSKDNYAKNKIVARPFLRDLEWEKAYVYAEAKGFSGFAEDNNITCHRLVPICSKLENWKELYNLPESVFKKDGSFKEFVDARKYLRRVHSENLGKPLYQNNAMNVIDIEARGCLAEGTEVLMFDGTIKKVEELKNGDLLLGKDGTPRIVSNLYIGESELYKVNHKINSFNDFTVNSHHTFSIKKRKYINGKYVNKVRQKGYYITEYTDINIRELLKIQHRPSFRSMYSRYRINKPIEFKEGNDLLINPYFLGLWLSDGRSNCTSVKITDNVLWDYLKQFCVNNMFDYKETIIEAEGNRKEAREIYIKCGYLRNNFYSYNLLNNKHIPNDYKLSDVKSRLLLLAGLIDGNGCYDTKCQNYRLYCGLNESIAQDSVFIARSLGFQSSYNKRIRDGFQDTYEVSINGDLSIVPCKLHRKQIDKINHRIDLCSSSFTLSSNGFGKYYSFSVDVDNEYLLSDFSIDHNSGKSYGMAGMVAHNALMDGTTDYDDYLVGLQTGNVLSSETLVGAIDGKYTKDLLNKTQLILDELVGEQMFQSDIYPSPLKKEFSGSWYSGKQFIEAKVDKVVGGKWKRVGSGSIIYNRSFSDNQFAGNGTRCSLAVLEEVGFFSNLIDSLGALKDTTYNGPNKFGVIYMTGTGGDMAGGSSEQAMEVFFDPARYDCLTFNDIWEESGDIGFFVPYELALNEFKDSEGNTNINKAINYVDAKRNIAQNGKNKKALYDEMQNNPRMPSEAFLVTNSSVFPVGELKEHLNNLKSQSTDGLISGQNGELVWIEENNKQKIKWVNDVKNKLTPTWYRMKKEDDTTGCIKIWEHPVLINGEVPYGMFLAGNDPYDHDQSTTTSLGSTFIYKTFATIDGIHEWIVAEYTARPSTAEEHHENVRKLLTYYNATCLYENERNSLKMHFQNKHSLHLLARTPTILKATEGTKVQRQYGLHMTDHIKDELEIYARDWLLKDRGNGRLNLHTIYSIPLLEELIYYNEKGNFDRVIAFLMTICNRLMNYHNKVNVEEEEYKSEDKFLKQAFSGKFFV